MEIFQSDVRGDARAALPVCFLAVVLMFSTFSATKIWKRRSSAIVPGTTYQRKIWKALNLNRVANKQGNFLY